MRKISQAKLYSWLRRYLPAEVLAITGAMGCGFVVQGWFQNGVVTALAATWGENVGFYGSILVKDIRMRLAHDEKVTVRGCVKVIRNLFIEFGVAEYLDSFLFRPFAMYFLPLILGNVLIGLFIGKLLADVTFYVPTVLFYEFRKKYLAD